MKIVKLLVFLAVLLSITSVWAAGSNLNFKSQDNRLDKKITINAYGTRIEDLFDQITQKTGINFYAGIDEKDWLVYDRKVIVIAKSMPVRELMSDLASVLKFSWKQAGDEGSWTYVLYQSDSQKQDEAALRNLLVDGQNIKNKQRYETMLKWLDSLSVMNPVDAENNKSRNPWEYVLVKKGLALDIVNLLKVFPEARESILSGNEIALPINKLPKEIHDACLKLAEDYNAMLKSTGAIEDQSKLLSDFDSLSLYINRKSINLSEEDNPLFKTMLGRISIGKASTMIDIPFFEQTSEGGKALGTAVISLESGISQDKVAKQLQKDLMALASSSNQSKTHDYSDSDLNTQVNVFESLKQPTATYQVALSYLSGKTGYNIVSDYFTGLSARFDSKKMKFGEFLDIMSSAYGVDWEKSGKTLLFTDKQWYVKRSWEVPTDWIDFWTERGKTNTGFLIEDMIDIAKLRNEQIDHFILKNKDMVKYGASQAAANRNILRFLATLDENQQKELLNNKLDITSISDKQWVILKKALMTSNPSLVFGEKPTGFAIMETVSVAPSQQYNFSYYQLKDENPIIFNIVCRVVYGMESNK